MKKSSVFMHIASNLALVFLLLSITVTCFVSTEGWQVSAGNADEELYRIGNEQGDGVSLMFNVYWGTDEVYEILNILDKHGAKSTFFIGGCWADDNVDCLKEIVRRGHEIGNHGYFHKDHSKFNETQNTEEISRCNQFISLATGVQPVLFAPPSGAYNQSCLQAAKALGMKTVLWSKDTIDWRDKDSALILKRATEGVRGGALVLMHPMAATVDALDGILNYYKQQNLRAVTVTENLQFGG